MGLFVARWPTWVSTPPCKPRQAIFRGRPSRSKPSRLGREARLYNIVQAGLDASLDDPDADGCPRGPSFHPAGLAWGGCLARAQLGISPATTSPTFNYTVQIYKKCAGTDERNLAHAFIFAIAILRAMTPSCPSEDHPCHVFRRS